MIKIKATNLPGFKNKMQQIHNKLGQMDIPHKKISIMLDRWVQKNFRSEGGKVGKWPILAAGGRWKSTAGKDGAGAPQRLETNVKILQDTGRLRLSFLPFSSSDNAGIGSELPYSKAHDDGIGVPKRRILPNISDVKKDITDVYEKHIKQVGQ